MNKVFLSGNLTKDPVVRTVSLQSGETTVVNFTVASSRYYKKKNGETEQDTEFIECEGWDSGAKTMSDILRKGDPVLIEGAIKNNSWEDKETGQKRSRTKIRVERFEKLHRKSASSQPSSETGSNSSEQLATAGVGDEHGNGDDIDF